MTDIAGVVNHAIGNAQHEGMNDADKIRWDNTADLASDKGFKRTALAMNAAAYDGVISSEEVVDIEDKLSIDMTTNGLDKRDYVDERRDPSVSDDEAAALSQAKPEPEPEPDEPKTFTDRLRDILTKDRISADDRDI